MANAILKCAMVAVCVGAALAVVTYVGLAAAALVSLM